MGSPLRELLAVFDISVNDEELETASKRVEGFTGKLKLAFETVGEAVALDAVKEFFTESIEQAAHIQDLSERLGVAASSISGFGFAAKSAGVDMDTAAYALGMLQKNIGLAVTGGTAQAQYFQKLGVQLKDQAGQTKPFNEVLLDVAEAMKRLPTQAERAAFAMETLGRSGQQMLPILVKGREGVEEFLKEAGDLGVVLGDDFYANAKKAREEGEHFGFAMQALKDRALITVLPVIQRLLVTMVDWTKRAIEVTTKTSVLQTLMIAIATVSGLKLLGTLRALATTFGILQPTIGGTVAALMRFASPLLLAAALYLLFDELYTLMTGGKSIIGDTVDELMGVGSAAELALYLNAILKDTWAILKDVGSIVTDTVVAAFETLLDEVKGVSGALAHLAKGDFSGALDAIRAGNTEADKDLQKREGGIADAAARMINGTDTKHLEDLDVLIKAGVDPRMLQAGALGRATAGAAAATREGIVAQNTNNPLAHGWMLVPTHHAAAAGLGPGGILATAPNGARVDLKVINNIHTRHDNPKAVGDAAGMGTATGVEKANNAALASAVKP